MEVLGDRKRVFIQTKLMNICLGKILNELRNYEIKMCVPLVLSQP